MWATNWFKESGGIDQLTNADDKALLEKKRDGLLKKLETRQQVVAGTNYPDALFGLATRKSNNMIAGVVVIRRRPENQGSASTLAEALHRFHNLKVPIFTVASARSASKSTSASPTCKCPRCRRPTKSFRCGSSSRAKGCPSKEFDCSLDIFKPGQDPAKDKPAYVAGQGEIQGGQRRAARAD